MSFARFFFGVLAGGSLSASVRYVCPVSEIDCERPCANDIDATSVDIKNMLPIGRIDRVALILPDTETWRSVRVVFL
jgi:hypothetical protein